MSDAGVCPGELRVQRDGDQVTVRTPYYEIAHGLEVGGGVCSVRFPQAGVANIVIRPFGFELRLEGEPKIFRPCGRTTAEVDTVEGGATASFRAALVDEEGRDCGVSLRTVYRHRWGYVRVRQELEFPAGGLRVSALVLQDWALAPDLTHFGVRPGAPAEASSWPRAFGVCQWGRFRPGHAFDSTYESRFVPRYAGFANPGRCGIEWFVGSDLAQWDYQAAGRTGVGSLAICSQPKPAAVIMRVCPVDVSMGGVRMAGRYVFDSVIGVPVLTGRARPPFLHASFNRKHWPSEADVTRWARGGIRTAHFHHDGDAFDDGVFWRDGRYPPFGPDDMKEFDRVIAACHRHDIRVATYFSNKELHPSTAAFQQHGSEWARLPDDRGQVLHNTYRNDEFGAQMCLKSGWAEFFRNYVDTVLSHHDLDGTYYDWNVGLYCHNARHVGLTPRATGPGLGAQAESPAGHWDMDELLDLMEWTRRRVGPDGLVIVHNTMVPMAAMENFADCVVAMEWGYSQLALGAPELDDLPMEWTFMGARARGVIGYGCVAAGAPARIARQMAVRCLMTGVAPWPAKPADVKLFAPLTDIEYAGGSFFDWRTGFAVADDPAVATAAYRTGGGILVLVGNLTSKPAAACVTLDRRQARLRPGGRYCVRLGSRSQLTTGAALSGRGVAVRVAGDSITPIWIEL